MESLVAATSSLKVEQKFKQYQRNLIGILFRPEQNVCLPDMLIPFGEETDEDHERKMREKLEAEIPEAELETVELKYIPEYIRELKKKTEYWQKEYVHWNDLISKKNWMKYEKDLNNKITKLKTVIKNLDKELDTYKHLKSIKDIHLSHSLDRKRVQTLIDYIKKNESNDEVLKDMIKSAVSSFRFVETAYVKFAIYAMYGDYRCRPSRRNSLREEVE